MRYLTLDEVIALHAMVVAASGGSKGIRDLGGIESAVAQPQMAFADADLYPTLCDKAAALGFSLICNHPFVDGNKRIGHAAMETMLWLNGFELQCEIDEQERVVLEVASGQSTRAAFTEWVRAHIVER